MPRKYTRNIAKLRATLGCAAKNVVIAAINAMTQPKEQDCNCDTSRPMTKGEAEIAKRLDEFFEHKEPKVIKGNITTEITLTEDTTIEGDILPGGFVHMNGYRVTLTGSISGGKIGNTSVIHSTRQEAYREGFEACKERVREGLPEPAPLSCEDCTGTKQTCELYGKGFNYALYEVRTFIDNLGV